MPGRPKGPTLKELSVDAYKCVRCGKKVETPKGVFPYLPKSPIYAENQGFGHICLTCVDLLETELKDQYRDQKSAFIALCHYLDVYYDDGKYEEMKYDKNFSFRSYYPKLNAGLSKKTFKDNLNDLILVDAFAKSEEALKEEKEKKWSAEDLRNKQYVITSVGYDPFGDPSLSQFDLRFLYNTCADYLDDDTVGDPHRVQSVLELVNSLLQQDKVNRLITEEYAKASADPKRLKDLVDIKRDYSAVVSTIANENGISLKGSGKSQRGSNTFTKIMKDMGDKGIEESKPNYLSAKMEASYRELAAINLKAIQDELNLQSDEYASMVSEQAVIISQVQEEIDQLKEENRLLRIELEGKK